MMMRLVPLVFVALLLAGCKAQDPPARDARDAADAPSEEVEGQETDPDVVSGTGTIRYQDLEGGFYGLVTDDDVRYNPTNLDDRFKEDGLKVRFRARVLRDVMTIQMWGKPVEVLEMTAAN